MGRRAPRGLTFLPYLAGERTPHADPDARGSFTGLGLRHDRGALVRAVLEGVAFGLRDALDLLADRAAPTSAASRAAARAASCGCGSSPPCSSCRSSAPPPTRAPPSAPRCSAASPPASGATSETRSPRPSARRRRSIRSPTGSSRTARRASATARSTRRSATSSRRRLDRTQLLGVGDRVALQLAARLDLVGAHPPQRRRVGVDRHRRAAAGVETRWMSEAAKSIASPAPSRRVTRRGRRARGAPRERGRGRPRARRRRGRGRESPCRGRPSSRSARPRRARRAAAARRCAPRGRGGRGGPQVRARREVRDEVAKLRAGQVAAGGRAIMPPPPRARAPRRAAGDVGAEHRLGAASPSSSGDGGSITGRSEP